MAGASNKEGPHPYTHRVMVCAFLFARVVPTTVLRRALIVRSGIALQQVAYLLDSSGQGLLVFLIWLPLCTSCGLCSSAPFNRGRQRVFLSSRDPEQLCTYDLNAHVSRIVRLQLYRRLSGCTIQPSRAAAVERHGLVVQGSASLLP